MTGKAIYPSDTPSRRHLADMYAGQEISEHRCQSILCLVMEKEPSCAVIREWTEEQRHHAANWAMREYMYASDNRVLRLLQPDWLKG